MRFVILGKCLVFYRIDVIILNIIFFKELRYMSTKETVLNALKNSKEPLKAGDISDMTGIDKAEVDKAIKDLKKEEKIVSPKRCFYSVNE